MRILLAILLSTSFAQAMNDGNGDVGVNLDKPLTKEQYLHLRIQQLRKEATTQVACREFFKRVTRIKSLNDLEAAAQTSDNKENEGQTN